MKCRVERAPTAEQLDADKIVTIGMGLVLLALSEHWGWGKKRMNRLYDQAFALAQKEFRPKSPRYTKEYRDDLEYQLDRILRLLTERME